MKASGLLPLPTDFKEVRARALAFLNSDPPIWKRPLLHHQKKAVAHMCGLRYSLLFDQMGVGKTCQALAFDALSEAKTTLIFCPNSVKETWMEEIQKFTPYHAGQIYVGKGRELISLPSSIISRFKFFIFNYETLRIAGKTAGVHPMILREADHVLFDEVHFLRNSYTQAWLSLAEFLAAKRPRFLSMLTGTPVDRSIVELYSYLYLIALNPHLEKPAPFLEYFPKQEYFSEIFGKKGRTEQVDGRAVPRYSLYNEKNLHLIEDLMGAYAIRRETADVVELPKLHEIRNTIPDNYINVDFDKVEDKLQMAFRIGAAKEWEPRATEKALSKSEIMLGMIQQIRVQMAMAKIYWSYIMAKQYLQNIGPVIIFSEFVKPLKEFEARAAAEGYKTSMVYGELGEVDRFVALEDFKKGKTQFLACTFGTLAEGVNLQQYQTVIFNDICWQPTKHFQAQCRVHRIGQKGETYNILMVCRGDQFVLDTFYNKGQMIGLLNGYLAKLKNKYELI